jgi:hypothetical protein
MFVLETDEFPKTTEQLTTALNDSLRRWIERAGAPMASATGTYPALLSGEIDISGGTIAADTPLPDVQPATALEKGLSVKRFRLVGKPLRVRGVAMELELTASDATFAYARNRAEKPVVVLQDAREGQLHASISRADLESAMLQAARAAAEPNGIAVQRVEAMLSTPNPRELDARLTITAKKFVTAVVRVRGRASIDDQLHAKLSGLLAEGEGMVAKLAVGLLQGHLQKLEGQQFSLLAFSLGNVRLRDVGFRVDPASSLFIEAAFVGRTDQGTT